jgi:hypothetical protein
MKRQILVGTELSPQNPNALTASITGTRYFVGNPDILEVSSEGLITAKQTGVTTVTVINQGAENTITVQVGLPTANNSSVGTSGGAVRAADGVMVTIAPGALTKDAVVSIQTIAPEQISLPLPTSFQMVGAFRLDVGSTELDFPAQIAIAAPVGLAEGTEVFFLRKGELPDEQGIMQSIWLMQESGRVGTDGMIRTSSPPWQGVSQTGEYTVVVPAHNISRIDVEAYITKLSAVFTGALTLALLSAGLGFSTYTKGLNGGGILAKAINKLNDKAQKAIKQVQDGSIDILAKIPALLDNAVPNTQVSILTIPTYGLPYVSTTGVKINPGQIPTARVEIIPPQQIEEFRPFIKSVELKQESINNSVSPIIFLAGDNFGDSTQNLKVDLIKLDDQSIELEILPGLSGSGKLAVRPTNLVPISAHGKLQITRTYSSAYQATTQFLSNQIVLPDQSLHQSVSLVPLTWSNEIAVYNTTDPYNVIANSAVGSPDLLLAKIPVGVPGATTDGPRYVATNSGGTVGYAPLEQEGKLAVIDLIAMQQVNTNNGAADPTISLPEGAHPFSIVVDHDDKYAYVADRNSVNGKGLIYVVDVDPTSPNYHIAILT